VKGVWSGIDRVVERVRKLEDDKLVRSTKSETRAAMIAFGISAIMWVVGLLLK
jgi:hypothetical protein